jgi:hypothetical protein
MANISWPISLPAQPERGYSESIGTLILRSPMDAGPAKQRVRARRPDTLSVQYTLTSAQVTTLRTFFLDSIAGTLRFNYTHPRTGSTVEVRVIPQQSGELFQVQYLAPGYYRVNFQLEILP